MNKVIKLILKFRKLNDDKGDTQDYEIIDSAEKIDENMIPHIHHVECTRDVDSCEFFNCMELSRQHFSQRVNEQAEAYVPRTENINPNDDQFVSEPLIQFDNAHNNAFDTTFDTSSHTSSAGSDHSATNDIQTVNTARNSVTMTPDDCDKKRDQNKLDQANKLWGIKKNTEKSGPDSSLNFNDTQILSNKCSSVGDSSPQETHQTYFTQSSRADKMNLCTPKSSSNPYADCQIMNLPRVKRLFIPEFASSWLITIENIFSMYNITDDCHRYYIALQNISTVFLDKLSPYVKGRSWKLLREGIQKVFGTMSYSQQLNAVENLTMNTTPRELLNQILSCLNLS